jgi:dipeptidyl aminopeptidase/acylaminoacyl peptidase
MPTGIFSLIEEKGDFMKQIRIEDFIKYKYLSGLIANARQTHSAYLVSMANVDSNEYHHQLCVYDGEKHQKIASLKSKSHFIWVQDDLLYQYAASKREEKLFKEEKRTLYYRYDFLKKSNELAYNIPFPAQIIKVLSQNTLLLSSFLSPEMHQLYQIDEKMRKAFLKKEKEKEAFEEINEIPFYSNGQGFISQKRNQLLIYNLETQSIYPISDLDFNVGIIKVSLDQKKIYYTGQPHFEVKRLTSGVYVYDIETKETETLLLPGDFSIKNIYLLEHKIILALSDMTLFGINQNPDFYELKDRELILIHRFGKSLGNTIGSDVRLLPNPQDVIFEKHLYFVSTVDDHSDILKMDSKGTIEKYVSFKGSVDGIAWMNHELYCVGLYQQKLQEMYKISSNLRQVKKVSNHNNVHKDHYLAVPKQLTFKTKEHTIKGWILYPKDYHPDYKYPAILNIHGGPKTVYGTVYYHEMQVWANLGYFVCFLNPRGSDGKGDQFADIRGKYGTIDYQDIMAFMNLALEKEPSIEGQQLFVTGGSYGGFMTNWIIGHTDKFKAAATQRSISNWLSFHGTSDIGFYFSKDQTAGHPIDDTDNLWNQSPIKYVKKMTTPLLIIHSDQDYRCPIEQGMQLFTLLKEQGTKTKFVWFKGENHELSRSGKPLSRIKRLEEITSWFESFREPLEVK